MKKNIVFLLLMSICLIASSCKKYLDVVPDNIPTIDDAFTSRIQAEKFLYTCYSYLPADADPQSNPAMLAGDELWLYSDIRTNSFFLNPKSWFIALGEQTATEPFLNYWDGLENGKPLFRGIRDCNTFLEKIGTVRDLNSFERGKWMAEVKFLKAYYHFYLLRMYGPIPITDKNLPTSSSAEEVRVNRRPFDECVAYIVKTLEEAATSLPVKIEKPIEEMGRITKPIALSIKARVLLMAASPLYNGNTDFASLKNKDGLQLFNQVSDPKKWDAALLAAKEAITSAEGAGARLYEFVPPPALGALSNETILGLSIQSAITEKWNTEIIWGLSNNNTSLLQSAAMPRIVNNITVISALAPTHRMAELFYSKNGVPITEDKSWNLANRNKLRTATAAEKFYIKQGYETAEIHFDREPRFYADMGFDGGIWYGLGKNNEAGGDVWHVQAKFGQTAGRVEIKNFSVTGYWPKKLVSYLNTQNVGSGHITQQYSWPNVRLADLYLIYAEASNEVNGPGNETYNYLDKIRKRAGLKGVVESWANNSNNPNKPSGKEGLRSIIHQERMIEMAFEGSRFWDLRRWKEAESVYRGTIKGWDIEQKEAVNYYREKILATQTFELKDYFWPIKNDNIQINDNLVQNVGW